MPRLPALFSRAMLLTSLLLLLSTLVPLAPGDEPLRVLSFNIRYDNPGDGLDAWPNRKDRVAGLLRLHHPDVFGLQEALRSQIDDLSGRLPEYAWLGVGRDDGADGGEFSPIFYRPDRIEVIEHGTMWLSETPDVPGSVGWDAALPRVATWARLRDKNTGTAFHIFNTHFDHRGEAARQQSASLLVDRLSGLPAGIPAVLMGDFNVTDATNAYRVLVAGPLRDARSAATHPPYGPEETFFGFDATADSGRRIDYIFVTPEISVGQYAVLADVVGGRYPSDHLPVLADLLLP